MDMTAPEGAFCAPVLMVPVEGSTLSALPFDRQREFLSLPSKPILIRILSKCGSGWCTRA